MEHSAILLTFIKLPVVIKFVFFEWLFYTDFTVMLWVLKINHPMINEMFLLSTKKTGLNRWLRT